MAEVRVNIRAHQRSPLTLLPQDKDAFQKVGQGLPVGVLALQEWLEFCVALAWVWHTRGCRLELVPSFNRVRAIEVTG